MDKIFIRNFIIFVTLLFVGVSIFLFYFIFGEKELGHIDKWVKHTNQVISEAEHLSSSIQGMVVSQRGYLLSQDKDFILTYEEYKKETQKRIKILKNMTVDNASQQERLSSLDLKYKKLSSNLETSIRKNEAENTKLKVIDLNKIRGLKNEILEINSQILSEEYNLLNIRIKALENKKSQYLITLIGGVIIGSILLLIFNAFLLKVQRKRVSVEGALKESEDRFALALQGTQDGIFDWDIKTGEVFYSNRFFTMLGYDNKSSFGTVDDFRNMLHPDDLENVNDFINKYLNGEIQDYICEFRLKHKQDYYIWIQSRAKALFDNKGNAYRMVGAHTDITYMKEEQERLEKEKDKAEDANKAKGEFLAHMSHEIRTPLTAISGIAEIFLKKVDMFEERHQKLVRTLVSSSSTLKDIVNDVLDFSKIESGDIELEERMFLIEDLFSEVISIMNVKASQENINFIFDDSKTKDVSFYGDKIRIRQILINLIGNSLKFTEAGGLVKVTTNLENKNNQQFLRISVSDTGIGIKPEDFDSIFERFKQADASVSRKYGGTGLGLPISKNLAQIMGGDIYLSSQFGDGSTFSIILPMIVEHYLSDETKKQIKDIERKSSKHIPNSKSKILLVEDYSGNIEIIGYILEDLKITYDVAKNGKEAIDLWNKNTYDLILMDVQMPVMDGFTATNEIRKQEKENNHPRTPIIGMTAHALVGDKDKCIDAGMDSYLPKPIVEENLIDEICNRLNENKN